jgi:hypothetical protein
MGQNASTEFHKTFGAKERQKKQENKERKKTSQRKCEEKNLDQIRTTAKVNAIVPEGTMLDQFDSRMMPLTEF